MTEIDRFVNMAITTSLVYNIVTNLIHLPYYYAISGKRLFVKVDDIAAVQAVLLDTTTICISSMSHSCPRSGLTQ